MMLRLVSGFSLPWHVCYRIVALSLMFLDLSTSGLCPGMLVILPNTTPTNVFPHSEIRPKKGSVEGSWVLFGAGGCMGGASPVPLSQLGWMNAFEAEPAEWQEGERIFEECRGGYQYHFEAEFEVLYMIPWQYYVKKGAELPGPRSVGTPFRNADYDDPAHRMDGNPRGSSLWQLWQMIPAQQNLTKSFCPKIERVPN